MTIKSDDFNDIGKKRMLNGCFHMAVVVSCSLKAPFFTPPAAACTACTVAACSRSNRGRTRHAIWFNSFGRTRHATRGGNDLYRYIYNISVGYVAYLLYVEMCIHLLNHAIVDSRMI